MATGGAQSKNLSQAGVGDDGDGDGVGKQCAICLEKYRRPKLLPCFHSFCQSCLQGVAGTSPSFPCPSCRSIVLLPPGGVGALQTNFYIEDDQSSPPQRLCDVCAEDREATHSCIQCQQRYCLPCRQVHDSIRVCRGHSVVPLTPGEGEGCGKGVPEKAEMCPKHPDQRLLLHCSSCQADLCLQCKLTQHEAHPTQDLADSRSKVKDKLKDKLGTLTLDMQQMDHMVRAFKDRCSKVQQQRKTMEQACQARADTLQQWVKQSLEEAVQSFQVSAKQRSKPWQDHVQQLCNKKLSLQAQQDHILQVLRGGKEADMVSLEAQLSSGPVEDVDMKEMMSKLTQDIPSFHLEHVPTAVNQLQLRSFIGVLEAAEQTSVAEETSIPTQPQSARGKVSNTLPVKVSATKHRTAAVPSANSGVGVVGKKPPRELIYSKNPDSVVYCMCPISKSRLWVLYRSQDDDRTAYNLKLFDAEGQVLSTAVESSSYDGLLSITDDVMLAWKFGFFRSSVWLVSPDGILTTYNMREHVGGFVSRAANDILYLTHAKFGSLLTVKFASASKNQIDSADILKKQVRYSILDNVFNSLPSGLCHVSAGGRYFACCDISSVEVYTTTESKTPSLVCSYQTKKKPTDARFCRIDGQEMLLVAVQDDNKIHVIDHTDGGYLVRCLDTGPLNLDRPCCLATDSDQHLWIGCHGGKVVMVNL